MNATIYETKDYSKFEVCAFNREVRRIKPLEASMMTHGWISAYPLHCVKNGNGKLHIKAGHHRFDVARSLGLPIKYVLCDDDATIHELEKASNRWDLRDYLESYCRVGKHDYLMLKRYHEATGIPVYLCLSLLSGQTAGSNNWGDKFKNGEYRVATNNRRAAILADVVLHCKSCKVDFHTNERFVGALSRLTWLPEFDHKHLKDKISKFPHLMQKQPTVATFLQMLETVYNMQSRTKIPLAFLATQATKQRSAVKKAA